MITKDGIAVSVNMKTQITGGEEEQVITLSADGRIFKKDVGLYLQFKEETEEVGSVNQVVKLDDNQTITIIRQGAVSMKQLFQQGIKSEGVYRSPFGIMLMNTETKYININIDEQKVEGTIRISYQLHMQDEFAGNYDITIQFRRND
ncbi:DUF1934 domain-containing protein [Anaerobacillus alkaliphilus]|uniref:DUF1934 domain-containing protein n=1 Tax=Anaerobacillus alkaliphilus TaxID=1548597 RepID=A0A4Q0VV46_9BACI|nr:DUF1934 domain-containing protein [Anaerobacillus alkaliphilus]RXJ02736.1 DUF1934 domain-containing protein [Anaerobacillus alkaliphilus]